MRIEIPEFSLVVMIGASSAGKTSFAKKNFLPTEIFSSDFFRAMVCDDEQNQSATSEAFDLLFYAVEKRLKAMKTTVIDATNLKMCDREKIIALSKKHNVHTVAIVLDPPEKVLLERNKERSDRNISESILKNQRANLKSSIKHLKKEGFSYIYILNTKEEIDNIEIVRTKLWNNKKDEHGPFDIIGDIHGCCSELEALLEKLGYIINEEGVYFHPEGRKAVFLGDLCDRGDRNADVLDIVMNMVRFGSAFAVIGNHDYKLLKYLNGKNVNTSKGLDITIKEIEDKDEKYKDELRNFIRGRISHYVFDNGRLVVSHAGIKEEYIGRGSKRVKDFCLYGDVTGENDEYGAPVRLNWAADYRGKAIVVYGHTPRNEVVFENNTYCIDTGCVFGNKLTAFRYPEKEIVSVKALREYAEPVRPILTENDTDDGNLKINDVSGKLHIMTELTGAVTINESNSAAALEVMSRFAANPHWLIYLPPTMSPCATSKLDGYLEYPTEAFEYYKNNGIKKVICEKKHMGSRAVIVLCRNAETARKRFGVDDGSRGIIYTRTGRRFFKESFYEERILNRLDSVLEKTGFWKDFDTDWVCFDTELMPWSEKARELLRSQYAPIGSAGILSLSSAVDALKSVCKRENKMPEIDSGVSGQNVDPMELLKKYETRKEAVEKYTAAYREYCWRVVSENDFRIAPFHLLAVEGRVFSDEKHIWHIETLKKYCTGIDDIFIETEYTEVDTDDEESVRQAVEWWLNLTKSGGEGMVVKPEYFVSKNNARLLQPAVKCRGAEYLRIIYGPEYLMPENLKRLKKRRLALKQSLALKEFSLGMESLKRFTDKKPLYKIHECVFGILAFESEPVDPRL